MYVFDVFRVLSFLVHGIHRREEQQWTGSVYIDLIVVALLYWTSSELSKRDLLCNFIYLIGLFDILMLFRKSVLTFRVARIRPLT